LTRSGFSERKQLAADSLPAMLSFDEEFVNPGAFAAVFEAVIETEDQVADERCCIADEVGDATNGILEKLDQIRAECGLVEGIRPGIVELHAAHQVENGFEIGGGGLGDGERHRSLMDAECAMVLYGEIVRGANTGTGVG
jgi:hypothetical protein